MEPVMMNGPRSLISRKVGGLAIDGMGIAVHVPSVPTGGLCIPFFDLVKAKAPQLADDDISERCRQVSRNLIKEGHANHTHIQWLIAEGRGCIPMLTAGMGVGMIEIGHGREVAEVIADEIQKLMVAEIAAHGEIGGDLAEFESLTALYRCAPLARRRNRTPGHWYRWRGKDESQAFKDKGIWRTKDGEWMAAHALATSYAQWLFPEFMHWTIGLIVGDPRVKAAFWSMIGARSQYVQEAQPATPLKGPRLVIDNEKPE